MSFLLGIAVCAVAIALVALGGGNPVLLFDYRALLLVLCGTLASVFVTLPFSAVREELASILASLRRAADPHKLMQEILEFARIARRSGILSLEGKEKQVRDPILKKGLVLLADSADHETVRSILEKEADCISHREKSAQEYIERTAAFAPGIGMVGTLVEIVQMLYKYGGPSTLAPQIARSLLPVLYGAGLAYLLLLPFAARVRVGTERLRVMRELAIEGVVAIQAGEPIHIVEERLKVFLPPQKGAAGRTSR